MGSLDPNIRVPQYDRSSVTTGIVHIGPGGFPRGHILRYIDEILETDPRWGVTAISLKSPDARNALKGQDYLYSLTEQSSEKDQTRIIGSLKNIIVAQEAPQEALKALIDPNIKLVTLTVTQAGYGHDPATGLLDFKRADIKKCLDPMDEPSTAVGYLVAALDERRKSGAPSLTIMSCDNIPGNGIVLRNVVLAYAAEKSRELRQYIEDNIAFPSTMVDRIVPRRSKKHVFNARALLGLNDNWPIYTEPFSQWVIEDNFAGEVPDFASVGALITDDVVPFELMKIRMLNGSHMALGCVGKLAGFTHVHEAMENIQIAGFVDGFMGETSETLNPIQGVNVLTYQASLIERLLNPKMEDELVRLARNGTQKLPGRILDPLKDAIAHGQDSRHLTLSAASWMRYVKGIDCAGNEFDIMDETAVQKRLQQIARNSNGNPQPVIAASGLFNSALQGNKPFMDGVTRDLHNIQKYGMLGAIAEMQKANDNTRGFVLPARPLALVQK